MGQWWQDHVVIPIVTPEEMNEIDRAASEPVDVLIGRAGAAVARCALDLLGGSYGRRVVIVEGKGNNGNDGRDAAERLRRSGVRVIEVDATEAPSPLPTCDLVIDAAFGTGFRGEYEAPDAGEAAVLAVDIPSGVDGLTGVASGRPLTADLTVTFAALKPGLLFADGASASGQVEVADIGLDTSTARARLVEPADVASWLPPRSRDTNKWKAAVWAVAGSPGMTGAGHLCAHSAQRAGAGYVRLSSPGLDHDPGAPTEAVGVPLPEEDWAGNVLEELDRFDALVMGPGLGRSVKTGESIARVLKRSGIPVVLDGDALFLLGTDAAAVLAGRGGSTVLTPHDGEYARLTGSPPGADRLGAVRDLASRTGSIVLLKGATTVVADPDGLVLVCTAGSNRLATAGTGDVLSGVIAAFLARGVDAHQAAAAAAVVHGVAAWRGRRVGLVASDLPELVSDVLGSLGRPG